MKPKHTSGPWTVAPAFEKSKLNIRGPTGNALAQVLKEKHPHEANARLIAAAPELLAALAEIGQLIDAEILVRAPSLDGNSAAGSRTLKAAAMLVAALAKATGDAD